jgi:hypothetical protein
VYQPELFCYAERGSRFSWNQDRLLWPRARQVAEQLGLASAAVFIRDSIETLRKHYADLDSGDIRVSE